MDNKTAQKIVNEGNIIHHLTLRHIEILFNWYDDNKYFGFKGSREFEEQLYNAVDFLIKNEQEWQIRINDNYTNLTLEQYLISKGRDEGIQFPKNFIEGAIHGFKSSS